MNVNLNPHSGRAGKQLEPVSAQVGGGEQLIKSIPDRQKILKKVCPFSGTSGNSGRPPKIKLSDFHGSGHYFMNALVGRC
jgi:hypothetical protein